MLENFRQGMEIVSQWAIPMVMLTIILAGAWQRVPMYDSFVKGAKEGFEVAVMIIPYLVAILFVIKVFIASGIFDDARYVAGAAMARLELEEHVELVDLLPLALTRPLTGGGAQGVYVDILQRHGADSFLGLTGSLMMGSTETTFYIMTIYYGAVHIKNIRHTLAACLMADAAGMIAAIVCGYLLYR